MSPFSTERSEEITQFTGEYRFLSNFWIQPVLYQGTIYQSAEHAYQACKTSDPGKKKRIIDAPTPGTARRLGRQLSDYTKREWSKKSIQIMTEVIQAKFSNPDLRKRLLETGDKILIEGNRHGDDFWGVCPPTGGKGRNWLGRLLMEERERVRSSTGTTHQHIPGSRGICLQCGCGDEDLNPECEHVSN